MWVDAQDEQYDEDPITFQRSPFFMNELTAFDGERLILKQCAFARLDRMEFISLFTYSNSSHQSSLDYKQKEERRCSFVAR